MRKFKAGMILLLIAMVFAFAAYADNSPYKWGMSYEAINEMMNYSVEPSSYALGYKTVSYDDQKVSDLEGMRLSFTFLHNQLICRDYENRNSYAIAYIPYLEGALTELYGEPSQDETELTDFLVRYYRSIGNEDDYTRENVKTVLDNIGFSIWKSDESDILLIYPVSANGGTGMNLIYLAREDQITLNNYNFDGL